MQGEPKTDRRTFLATAVTAAGSALTIGLAEAQAFGQLAAQTNTVAATHVLSFDGLYDTSILATTLKGEAADRLALRRLVRLATRSVPNANYRRPPLALINSPVNLVEFGGWETRRVLMRRC
jgi:hypothetical protein